MDKPTIVNYLAETLDHLIAHNLDTELGINISIRSGTRHGYLSIYITQPWSSEPIDFSARNENIRRAFGPFTPEHAPPSVVLMGGAQLPSFYLPMTWYRAYAYEATGEVVPPSERRANE